MGLSMSPHDALDGTDHKQMLSMATQKVPAASGAAPKETLWPLPLGGSWRVGSGTLGAPCGVPTPNEHCRLTTARSGRER